MLFLLRRIIELLILQSAGGGRIVRFPKKTFCFLYTYICKRIVRDEIGNFGNYTCIIVYVYVVRITVYRLN